jgi:hypothetical protein
MMTGTPGMAGTLAIPRTLVRAGMSANEKDASNRIKYVEKKSKRSQ